MCKNIFVTNTTVDQKPLVVWPCVAIQKKLTASHRDVHLVAANLRMPGSSSNERACSERKKLVTFSVLTKLEEFGKLDFRPALDRDLFGDFVSYCKTDQHILYGF